MKNKNVGYLIIGISIIISIIILIFNLGLKNIVAISCPHNFECVMYKTIKIQTAISLSLALLIFFIGVALTFFKEENQSQKIQKIDYSKLDKDEKIIIKILTESEGAAFQSEIVEKSNLNKVKVTRILDKLEGKQLINRRKRGMTNIVILKH